MLQSFISKLKATRYSKRNRLKTLSYRRYGKRREIFLFFCSRGCTRRNLCFHVENRQTRCSKTAHATTDLRSRHGIIPRPTRYVSGKASECRLRPRRYEEDPWTKGREVARGVLHPSPKPEKRSVVAIGEGSRIFVVCFLLISAQRCLYQTPGRRPPRITGRVVTTVARGWNGAPNERAPFRFHDAVVSFVDRCLSRTRNLVASN